MQKDLSRRPALLQSLFERLSSVLDVLAEQFAGAGDVALAAEVQDLVMLLVSPLNSVREIQLQTGVAVPAVVHVADDVHKMRPLGARI